MVKKITMTKILFITFLTTLLTIETICQSSSALYIPVTINSPLFSRDNELQIGEYVNNYGFNYKLAGQYNSKIIILSVQHSFGIFQFDPLSFNNYSQLGEETHLIQSRPTGMFYYELGIGYNFQHKTQKINLLIGAGRQVINPNTRLFVQFDWGNESRLMNAGISVRGNYTKVKNIDLFTLEPVIQGKLKIWNFRLVNQFGYSIAIKKNEDYMKPILTVGMEYIIGNASNNKGYIQ